jgi:twitching motility protein PilT
VDIMEFDFADLLMEVISRSASDLHLTAGAAPSVRVRGRLTPMDGYPRLTPSDTREIVYSILSNDQRQKLETDWQLDFAYSIPGVARFRVNAYFQRSAIGAAFRVIPADIVDIDTLGLPPAVHEFTKKPRGFVLVTGPTGSGKSTSLAAMIDAINQSREEHIMTVEDPIEFLHSHKKCVVNQREIGSDAQSFAMAIKAALRQDPDVILVGEMRDLETIGTALTAAETGHLVFATLHTQSAPQTIDRIIDVFPTAQQDQVRTQLSVALQGVMTQQLLPTADGSARVVACEVLVPTPAVRNLIREGKTHQLYSALQTGGAHGMQTMDAALADLVRGGVISRELAESRSSTPEELKRLLEGGVGSAGAAVPSSMPSSYSAGEAPGASSHRVSIGGPPNPNRR